MKTTIKTYVPYSTLKSQEIKDIEEDHELKRRDLKLAYQIWYIRAVQKMLPFQQILKNKDRIIQLLSLKLRPKQLHKKSTLKDIHERIAQADEELANLFKKYEIDDALGGAEAPSMAAFIRVPYKSEVLLKEPTQLRRVKGKEINKLHKDVGQNKYRTFHQQSAYELNEKKLFQESRLKDKVRLLSEGFI